MQRKSYRKPNNPVVASLIRELKRKSNEHDAPIWRRIADILSKPTRQRVSVNLSKIDRYATDGDAIVVPGKVLASGELSSGVNIAAVAFSEAARKKILSGKGKAMSILDLVKENPTGTKVRIII